MAFASGGRGGGWLPGLVLAPLVCAVVIAFLSPGGEGAAPEGAASAWGLPASAATPPTPLLQARDSLLASCHRSLRQGEAQRTLETVNYFFNRMPVRLAAPSAEAGWATPDEFLSGKGGAAVDYVVAKYFALRGIGIPASRLRVFVVGGKGLSQPHFVLAYYADPGAQPLILDNLAPAVRSAAERPELVPVYAFDPDAGDAPSGHRKWREMTMRMRG